MRTGKQYVKGFIVRVSVVLSLCGAVVATPAGAVPLNGVGTEANPYLIASLADLVTFRDWVNASNNCAGEFFQLTTDIDMTGVNWTPIGDDGSYDEYAIYFAGTFDGDGHTIKNIAIEDHAWGAALFGVVSGTIENLTIADSHVTGSSGGYALFVVIGTGDFTMRNCHAVNSYVAANSSSGLMLSYVDVGGTVAIADCDTDGDCYATEAIGYQIGGIVGQVCYTDSITFSGCTNNAALSGSGAIGGIVGQLGAATKTAVFTGCANSGTITVTGGAKYAGGLVGYKNMGGGVTGLTMAFTDCYNSGTVVGGEAGADLGGFVGFSNGTDASFTNCVNSGAIGDATYVAARAAGFIARDNSTADAIVFENCANTGAITGTSTGAFGVTMPTTLTIAGTATVNNDLTTLFNGKSNANYVEAYIAGAATTVYYADFADAVAAAESGDIVTLLADGLTAELAAGQSVTIDANGHSGLSITTVGGYKVVENAGTYTSVEFLPGSGTEVSPFLIASLADLVTFRDWVNAGNNCSGEYYQVTVDIDMSSESNWTPISDYGLEAGGDLRFAGTFDGGNFTLSHLTITSNPADLLGNTSDLMLGLFGAVGSANFRNIRLSEVDIGATNTDGVITNMGICAALLGNASGASTIRDVEVVSGSVKSIENAAGIYGFGTAYLHLSNCVNRADVTGYCSGGIASVAGRDSDNPSLIESCVNFGAIASHDNSGSGVGGILGKTQNNLVRNCTNHGSAKARNTNTYVGGICGVANAGSVFEDCVNHGEVTSDVGEYGRAGGIVGSAGGAFTFNFCINLGDVTGYQGAGGIVYHVDANASTLNYCYNGGAIHATHGDAGGLVGGLTGNATSYSLNDGPVTASGTACMTSPTTGASVYYHAAGVLYNADGTPAGITEIAACDALNTGLAAGSEFWGISAASGQAYPALFCDMPPEVWVDDNYTHGSCGGHVWNYDAFTSIQTGVDAVAAGGTVNVAAGTYNETITFASSFAKDNITITGEAGAEAETVVNGGIYMAFSTSRTGLSFRHMTLKGTCKPGQSFTLRADTEKGLPADTVFDNVIFDGENTITNAVRMLYVTNTLTFMNSTFKNYGSDWALINVGSKSPNGYNLVFNNNTVEDCDGCAQFFNLSNVTATNNAVSRIATHPSTWDALGFDGRANPDDRGVAIVTGNNISDNNAGGLIVSRFADATVSANTICGNATNSQNTGLSGFGLILEQNTTVTAENNIISIPSNLSATVESTGLILKGDGTFALSGNMINTVGDAAVAGIVRGVLVMDRTTGTALDLGDTALGAALPEYIAAHTTAPDALVNATAVTFAGLAGSGMTLEQLYDTENKITHKVDDAGRGFVRVKADNVYVTPGSGSIQAAIDAASPGDAVNVSSGAYREHLVVRKSGITLVGQDAGTTILDASQDPSWAIARAGILICGTGNGVPGASNVTVTGFTIRNAELDTNGVPFAGEEYSAGPGGMAGIQIYGSSGNTIEGNVIDRCGFQAWIVAEWRAAGYGDCHSNRIMDNTIRNSVRHGIYLYSDDTVSIADTYIGNNCISDVEANYSGIRFLSEGAGSVVRTLIENNTITSCYYGIRLNSLGDISGTAVRLNSIAGNISNGVYNGTGFELNAASNWWGAADGPGLAGPGSGDKISANVTYVPWYSDAAMTILCYPAVGLAFTTQPGAALPGRPFAQQPVVAMFNEIGGVASQFQGQVALAIGANPGGGVLSGNAALAAVNGVAVFTDLALDNTGVGYTLVASVAGYPAVTSAVFNVSKADQTIDFPAIPDQVATSTVVLSATASSGLPVSFAVVSGPGTISGNSLTFSGAGIVKVVASQAGDAVWNPAPNVTNSVAVRDVSSLEAPRNLAASDGAFTNQVALTWSPVSGATGYEVWRATANNAGAAVCLGQVGAPGYADASSEVLSAIRYYYWVKACNSAATSDFSNVDSGFCQLCDDPEILSGQPMVGDYDGDGKADPAVYDLATGRLYAWLSASAYALTAPVANFQVAAADLPVAGDFDGDGLADPGVFQNAAGAWYGWLSGSGYHRLGPAVFGVNAEDAPVPADYDGDGLTDPAVHHAASGEWYAWLSSGGYAAAGPIVMGTPGEGLAAPADYDGDGKADPAVYHAASGEWYAWLSSGGYAMAGPVTMETPGEHLAVPADYDGDGKADPASYIPTSGVWRVWQSGNGYSLLEAPLR